MAFYKTTGFKYFKNFLIGVGAAIVMIVHFSKSYQKRGEMLC